MGRSWSHQRSKVWAEETAASSAWRHSIHFCPFLSTSPSLFLLDFFAIWLYLGAGNPYERHEHEAKSWQETGSFYTCCAKRGSYYPFILIFDSWHLRLLQHIVAFFLCAMGDPSGTMFGFNRAAFARFASEMSAWTGGEDQHWLHRFECHGTQTGFPASCPLNSLL